MKNSLSSPPALFVLLFSFVATVVHAGPGSALAAMQGVPFRYNNGILQVAGQGGAPDPVAWTILAKDQDAGGTLTKLTMEQGQLVGEAPSFNAGQMFRDAGYIFIPEIQIDSTAAYEKAREQAEKSGHTLGSVDYLLERHGDDVDPAWTLTCHDASGRKIGVLTILATTGLVTVENGFEAAR